MELISNGALMNLSIGCDGNLDVFAVPAPLTS